MQRRIVETKETGALLAAADRVGATSADRVRWLLTFAARDLSALSAGGWLTLRWEAMAHATDLRVFRRSTLTPIPPLHAEIVDAQRWLSRLLAGLAGGTLEEIRIPHFTSFLSTMGGGNLRGGTMPGVMPWPSRFKWHVYDTLLAERHRFRFCQKCRSAFLAHKRQIYCSPKCSQALRTRKYRTQNREQFRGFRREAYERKVRRASGPNVKIPRRSRRG